MGSNERRLIVTADDFGLSDSVNQAVLRAHTDGILTCASLMVNEAAFEQAVSIAHQNPKLGVGLHLTLLDGHSTLPPGDIPGLVDGQGQFSASPFVAGCRYFLLPSLRRQLRMEIEAQLTKFRATGLTLDHVNSHHHIHAHPIVFKTVLEIARREGIRRLRLPFESILGQRRLSMGWTDRLNILFHTGMAARSRSLLRKAGIKHNDYIFGLSQTGRINEAYVLETVRALPTGVSELYAHPSLDEFRHELEALTSRDVGELLRKEGVGLIRFSEL